MKLIGAGFRDVVDLRSAVPALIDCVGEGVDCYLRDRIQSQDQIRRQAAIQVGQRIVGLQAIDNVAVRKRGQAIELHVAITIRAADEIVPASGRVDESARGEL